jgi:hypothetical protein
VGSEGGLKHVSESEVALNEDFSSHSIIIFVSLEIRIHKKDALAALADPQNLRPSSLKEISGGHGSSRHHRLIVVQDVLNQRAPCVQIKRFLRQELTMGEPHSIPIVLRR